MKLDMLSKLVNKSDVNNLVELNGTFTVSIPTDATYNFAIGTQINLLNFKKIILLQILNKILN